MCIFGSHRVTLSCRVSFCHRGPRESLPSLWKEGGAELQRRAALSPAPATKKHRTTDSVTTEQQGPARKPQVNTSFLQLEDIQMMLWSTKTASEGQDGGDPALSATC